MAGPHPVLPRSAGVEDGELQAPGCDGLTINLHDLWSIVDQLDDESRLAYAGSQESERGHFIHCR